MDKKKLGITPLLAGAMAILLLAVGGAAAGITGGETRIAFILKIINPGQPQMPYTQLKREWPVFLGVAPVSPLPLALTPVPLPLTSGGTQVTPLSGQPTQQALIFSQPDVNPFLQSARDFMQAYGATKTTGAPSTPSAATPSTLTKVSSVPSAGPGTLTKSGKVSTTATTGKDGNKVVTTKGPDGKVTNVTVADKSGKTIKETVTSYQADGSSTTITKGPGGKILGTVATDKSGKPTTTTVFTYGKDGKFAAMETMKFNDKGQVASHTKKLPDGKTVNVVTSTSVQKTSTGSTTKPVTPAATAAPLGKLPTPGPGQAVTSKPGGTTTVKSTDLKAPAFATKSATPTGTTPASTTAGKQPAASAKPLGTTVVKPSSLTAPAFATKPTTPAGTTPTGKTSVSTTGGKSGSSVGTTSSVVTGTQSSQVQTNKVIDQKDKLTVQPQTPVQASPVAGQVPRPPQALPGRK